MEHHIYDTSIYALIRSLIQNIIILYASIRSALQIEIRHDPTVPSSAFTSFGQEDSRPGERDDESLCTYEDEDEAMMAADNDSDQVD